MASLNTKVISQYSIVDYIKILEVFPPLSQNFLDRLTEPNLNAPLL